MLRKIAKGYSWLVVVEALNNVVPLVVVPYLTRVLGVSGYGKTVLAMAIFSYMVILCDFGFSLHGVARIAQAKEEERGGILYSVTLGKAILAVSAFFLGSVWAYLATSSMFDFLLYVGTFVGVFGQGMFPVWFFQGVGKIKEGALIMLGTRSGYLILIFLLIQKPSDYFVVNLCFSASSIAAAVIAYAFLATKYRMQIFKPRTIIEELHKALPVFVTLAGTSLYRNANSVIIGMFWSPAIVAHYSIAEKVVKAVQGMVNPAAQALFPYHAKSVLAGDRSSASFRGIYGMGFLILLASACLSMILLAPQVILVLAGEGFPEMVNNLRLLSVVILLGGVSYWIGLLRFLSCGKAKEFAYLTNIMGFFSVIAAFVMVPFWGAFGAIVAMLVSELALVVLMLWRVRTHET